MFESKFVRTCCIPGCGGKITKCDGRVVGRDLLAVLEGRTTKTPRELCGNCGVLALLAPRIFLGILDLQDQIEGLKTQQAASS
jgi:hypothetical protein